MRTIKFRAWYKDNLVYFDLNVGFSSEGYKVYKDIVKNKIELQQFTGLTDKNGKEVWEGDIVHVIEDGDYGGEYNAPISYLDNWAVFGIVLLEIKEISKSKTNKRVDTIWTRGFLTRRLGACVQLHEAMKFKLCEVIGNIYENPELLKGEQS